MRDWSTEDSPAVTTPSTGMRPPGLTMTTFPGSTSARGTETALSPSRMRTVCGRKAIRSVKASCPRSTDKSSRISAARTKAVTTKAVSHSPMAAAATIAMSIDSSMLILACRISPQASTAIGKQPAIRPATAAAGKSFVG